MENHNHEMPRYRDWLGLTTRLLWCYDDRVDWRRTPPGRQIVPLYAHNSAWLVREGWAEVDDGKHTLRANPGEWLIGRPGRKSQRFGPETRLLSIAFDVHWADGGFWLQKGLSLVLKAAGAPGLESRARPMVRALERIAPDTWDAREHRFAHASFWRLQSALMLWLIELVDALAAHGVTPDYRDPVDERLVQARRRIDAWPVAEPLHLEQIAAEVGLSSVHLQRRFQELFSTTPKRYFDDLRLAMAQQRLRLPNTLVKEVASAVGFAHQAHFTRWYRQRTGCTPREHLHHEG